MAAPSEQAACRRQPDGVAPMGKAVPDPHDESSTSAIVKRNAALSVQRFAPELQCSSIGEQTSGKARGAIADVRPVRASTINENASSQWPRR